MKSGNKKLSRKGVLIVAIITLVVFISVGLLYQAKKGRLEIETAVQIDTFYDGIFIDDIPLAGLTMEQAKQKAVEKLQVLLDEIHVEVISDAQSHTFTASDISYSIDLDEVLNEAYSLGRSGSLEERYAYIAQLPKNPAKLYTALNLDLTTLESKVRDLAASLSLEPKDAELVEFNPAKPMDQRFVFSPEVPGRQVNADELWTSVKHEIEGGTYGTVQIQSTEIEPLIKIADLEKFTKLIASKTTKMVKNQNRQTNIQLASAAISGKVLMPGEVFSFNDATGERTAAKGYKVAHVITNGKIDDGLAGGVCQVSGTLYNAIVQSDLQIVERSKHSLTSTYLPGGQDATVDYGHYDMRFKNSQTNPIYIIVYSDDAKLTVTAEIYGQPLPDGQTIKMVSETTETINPTGIKYVPDADVMVGLPETYKAVIGKKITTYKVYYDKDGKEINRVLLYRDNYKEQMQEIHYNPADTAFLLTIPGMMPEVTTDPLLIPTETPGFMNTNQ